MSQLNSTTNTGFYFWVGQEKSRGYTKTQMRNGLIRALQTIPTEQRPKLYNQHCTYHLYAIHHDCSPQEALNLRQLIEDAVRRVHPRSVYLIGFKSNHPAYNFSRPVTDQDREEFPSIKNELWTKEIAVT